MHPKQHNLPLAAHSQPFPAIASGQAVNWPVTEDSPREQQIAVTSGVEEKADVLYATLAPPLPDKVVTRKITITGIDGNDVDVSQGARHR